MFTDVIKLINLNVSMCYCKPEQTSVDCQFEAELETAADGTQSLSASSTREEKKQNS